MQIPLKVRRASKQPELFDKTSLEDLDESIFSTFLGEDALNE